MNPTDPNQTLLPCPFCGESPRRFRFSSGDVARCEACGTTAMEAVKWNTRAPSAELTRTTESVEIGSKSVVAAPQTPRTDAAEVIFTANWINSYGNSISAVYADFARTLETELTQAQAELKELGERFDGLAKAHEAMIPHQVELRHERDAAVAELADVKPDRDQWEKLAREAAEARVALAEVAKSLSPPEPLKTQNHSK